MSSSPVIAFEIAHAVKYGVDGACLLYHFRHWIEFNHAGQRNFHEGRTWTYQSQEAIMRHFPWISRATLQRRLEDLCAVDGPLIKGNFNKNRYDRTVWYAFKNEDDWIRSNYKVSQCIAQNEAIDNNKMGYDEPQSGPTIPDYNPHDDKDKITPPASPPPKKSSLASEKGKEIANYLFEKLKAINPNHKEPDLNEWGIEVDRMIKIDKRDPSQIRKLIDWAMQDSFWRGNILSTHKLREQFDTLVIRSLPVASKAPVVDDAKAFLARVASRFSMDREIGFSADSIAFQAGQHCEVIKISEHGFKERVINKLIKWGRDVSGL